MTLQNIALMRGIGAKMNYLTQRQTLIASNIANADTPDYQPKDLKKADFSDVLGKALKKRNAVQSVSLSTTSGGHINPSGTAPNPKARDARDVYEVAPAGNAVIMEEQMMNASQTMMDYTMMTNLLQKNVGMIKTAIGR